MKDALERLPEKTKATVLLFDLADLSLESIRDIQGGTLSGVKSRLKRGHETLRKLLRTEYERGNPVRQAKKILIEREIDRGIEREEAYAV